MNLAAQANKSNNGALLAHIACSIPDIHLRKMLKIIYLIDEHFMKMRGFPLTWFDYFAWEKGPVAPEVYDIKNGAFADFVNCHKSKDNKRIVRPVCGYDDVLDAFKKSFSLVEVTEVDMLIDRYKDMSADELTDITHMEDALWSKVVSENNISFVENNGKSDCQIELVRLFDSHDSRVNAYKEARWLMELQSQLMVDKNPEQKIQLQVVTSSEREDYRIPSYTSMIP